MAWRLFFARSWDGVAPPQWQHRKWRTAKSRARRIRTAAVRRLRGGGGGASSPAEMSRVDCRGSSFPALVAWVNTLKHPSPLAFKISQTVHGLRALPRWKPSVAKIWYGANISPGSRLRKRGVINAKRKISVMLQDKTPRTPKTRDKRGGRESSGGGEIGRFDSLEHLFC